MEFLSVLNTESEIKILIPKARRLIPNKKQHKKKISKNNKQKIGKKANNLAEKSINLEDISLDEINNDFKALNEKSEEELCYNELSNILSSSSSSDDSLSNNKTQKNLKVKRPKKSIHFEDNNILSYFFF
jgi:hypothetical protein